MVPEEDYDGGEPAAKVGKASIAGSAKGKGKREPDQDTTLPGTEQDDVDMPTAKSSMSLPGKGASLPAPVQHSTNTGAPGGAHPGFGPPPGKGKAQLPRPLKAGDQSGKGGKLDAGTAAVAAVGRGQNRVSEGELVSKSASYLHTLEAGKGVNAKGQICKGSGKFVDTPVGKGPLGGSDGLAHKGVAENGTSDITAGKGPNGKSTEPGKGAPKVMLEPDLGGRSKAGLPQKVVTKGDLAAVKGDAGKTSVEGKGAAGPKGESGKATAVGKVGPLVKGAGKSETGWSEVVKSEPGKAVGKGKGEHANSDVAAASPEKGGVAKGGKGEMSKTAPVKGGKPSGAKGGAQPAPEQGVAAPGKGGKTPSQGGPVQGLPPQSIPARPAPPQDGGLSEALKAVGLGGYVGVLAGGGVVKAAHLQSVEEDELEEMGMNAAQRKTFMEIAASFAGQKEVVDTPAPPSVPQAYGKGVAVIGAVGKAAGSPPVTPRPMQRRPDGACSGKGSNNGLPVGKGAPAVARGGEAETTKPDASKGGNWGGSRNSVQGSGKQTHAPNSAWGWSGGE